MDQLLDDCRHTVAREGIDRIDTLEAQESVLVAFDEWSPRPEGARVPVVAVATTPSPIELWARAVVTVVAGDSQGSGVAVSSDGLLITNQHVVSDEDWVTIITYDGRELPGRVLARDEQRDLAVVKVGVSLPTLPLGGSARVGDEVVAIGAPKGLEQTVTRGIVSAHREADGVRFVQTDAPVSPGSSGGPLVSLTSGEIVGINTAIRRGSWADIQSGRGAEGIAFAVSSSELPLAFGQIFESREDPAEGVPE